MTSQFQVINKILQTKDFSIVSLNGLTADHFFNYKNEFNFIVQHYNKFNSVPDTLTFLDSFPDFTIQEVNEPDNYLLSRLIDDYNQAYLANRFNNIKRMLEADEVEKAVKYFSSSIKDLQVAAPFTSIDLLNPTERYKDYCEKISGSNNMFYLSTGFKEIDEATGGIDRRNENMVIAARPGIGKTWVLLTMATAALKQGLKVGIYSGEMTPDKVGYRFDTLYGHLDNKAITRGYADAKYAYEEYVKNLTSQSFTGCLRVITPATIVGSPTVATMRAFIEKEKLDILFIDQYSLLDDTSNAKSTNEKVANISKDIKRLQVLKQIPIISISQMNRTKNEDVDGHSYLDVSQIAASDRIGQDATTAIMLDRDKSDPQLIHFNIVKARDGGEGRFSYICNFNTGTFTYLGKDAENCISTDEGEELRNSYEN